MSIALLVSVFSFSNNLENYTYDFLSEVGGSIDLTIINSRYKLEISETLTEYVINYPGIKHVSPRIEGYQADLAESEILLIIGLDLELDSHFGYFKVINGSINFEIINSTFFSCVITRTYSQIYNLSIGDIISVDGPYFFNISAIVDAYDKGILGNVVIISLDAARTIFGMIPNSCNNLIVKVNDITEINSIKEGINSVYPGLYIKSPKSGILENVNYVLESINNYLLVITLIAVIFTSYKIFTTVSENFKDRILEFGVYRTLGYSKKQIIKLGLYEILIKTLIGGIIGLGLGLILTNIVLILSKSQFDIIFPNLTEYTPNLYLNPILIGLALLIGIIISIFSAVYPILKYSKFEIIDTLQFNKRRERPKKLLYHILSHKGTLLITFIIFSVCVITVFCFHNFLNQILSNIVLLIFIIDSIILCTFLGIHLLRRNQIFTGLAKFINHFKRRIISLNLKRRMNKNLIVIFMIFMGVFSFLFIKTLADKVIYDFSSRESFPSDADLILYSQTPVDPIFFIPQLESLEGIKNASGIGIHDQLEDINGKATQVFFVDPATINVVLNLNFVEGSDSAFEELNQNNTIISSILSLRWGLHLNDTVLINNTEFKIVGVVEEIFTLWSVSLDFSNFLFLSYNNYEITFDIQPVVYTIFVKTIGDPHLIGIEVEDTFPGIISIVASSLFSNYKLSNSFINLYADTLTIITALLILLSSFFIITLDIKNRINEIGLYRLLGMKKKEIRLLIINENIILMILGLGLSMIFSLLTVTIFFFLYDFEYILTNLHLNFPKICLIACVFGLIMILVDIIYLYLYLRHKMKRNIIHLFRKNLE